MGLVDKLFGNKSEKEITRIEKYVDAIEALDEKMQALSDEELRAKTQEFKVSLRSKSKVDVNKIASYFSGGGHVRAAGCTMQGSIYDVMNNLLEQIEKEIKEKMQ